MSQGTARRTRILIADDNQSVRRAVCALLAGENSCVVCGEASNASEAIQKVDELCPDLILLDVSMPGSNGLDTARFLRQRAPESKLVIMSHHDPVQLLPASLEAGAVGCLDKAKLASELGPLIRNMFER